MSDYKALCKNFKIDGDVLSVEPYGNGHINDTKKEFEIFEFLF